MIPFESDVINVIDSAYKAGYNIPKYFFQHSFDEVKDSLSLKEIYFNDPMFFVKPEGIDFTYILYWNGNRFRGGFIVIKNMYQGVQRGYILRNGETIFAAHIPELKRIYKRQVPEQGWIASTFVLSNGKIYYWGTDNIIEYDDLIQKLTGMEIPALEEVYQTEKGNEKPVGFVASIPAYTDKNNFFMVYSEPEQSISKAWKCLYLSTGLLPKNIFYTDGIDNYMRLAYSQLCLHKKII